MPTLISLMSINDDTYLDYCRSFRLSFSVNELRGSCAKLNIKQSARIDFYYELYSLLNVEVILHIAKSTHRSNTRTSYGYEIDLGLKPKILRKTGYSPYPFTDDKMRKDCVIFFREKFEIKNQ